jgi:hypothetical protein
MELVAEFASSESELNEELKRQTMRKKRQHIDDFLLSVRNTLFENVLELIASVGANDSETKASKKVNKRTIDKILQTCANLKDLNVVNDEKINSMLDDLAEVVTLRDAGVVTFTAADLQAEFARTAARVNSLAAEAVKEHENATKQYELD